MSCQSWAGGRFAAYRDLAEHDLDLVVHLGDYIYETARGDLDEFRRLHALYKSSPDLRAAHARFPFVLTWDDHEVQNNYAADVGGSAGDGRPFLERRANGYQAYYEHLPLREGSRPVGPDATMYRRVDIGRLAQLSVLDTRQYRSDQACGDGRKQLCEDAFDPAGTLTGPEQEQCCSPGCRPAKPYGTCWPSRRSSPRSTTTSAPTPWSTSTSGTDTPPRDGGSWTTSSPRRSATPSSSAVTGTPRGSTTCTPTRPTRRHPSSRPSSSAPRSPRGRAGTPTSAKAWPPTRTCGFTKAPTAGGRCAS